MATILDPVAAEREERERRVLAYSSLAIVFLLVEVQMLDYSHRYRPHSLGYLNLDWDHHRFDSSSSTVEIWSRWSNNLHVDIWSNNDRLRFHLGDERRTTCTVVAYSVVFERSCWTATIWSDSSDAMKTNEWREFTEVGIRCVCHRRSSAEIWWSLETSVSLSAREYPNRRILCEHLLLGPPLRHGENESWRFFDGKYRFTYDSGRLASDLPFCWG